MVSAIPCRCPDESHEPRLIVLTGGPGAGKTAVLEIARKNFCQHVTVLPEAASIVFGGGFLRLGSEPARRAAQRAIFHVQDELEKLVREEAHSAVVLCDRGTLDGLAYWPGSEQGFYEQLGTTLEREFAKYWAVIHLRTPTELNGYNHRNPIRTETAEEAAAIDRRILRVWEGHPRRHVVESTGDFIEKTRKVLTLIHAELPECCRSSG